MSIALISSLYRWEAHAPAFTAALLSFAQRVSESGIAVQYLPIVNDASRRERDCIERLSAKINRRAIGRMRPQYVPRESLYASWNRALRLTDAHYFAPWNADDIRHAGAFIAGYRALEAGAELVDFPFTQRRRSRFFRLVPRERRRRLPCRFERGRFTRANGLSAFFMASAALYQRLGPFDANFQVAGDTEWASRAFGTARFQAGAELGGEFLVHGGNLSNTGREREDIEVNIIFLRRRRWQQLVPANPAKMRAAWEGWGNPAGAGLPDAVADFLWGAGALRRWQRWQRERRQPPALRRIRLALAARGLIHSIEWSLAQGEHRF